MTNATMTPREQLLQDLRAELEQATQGVEGGPWDGRQVVPAEDVKRILDLPLAPATEHAAEVLTPARIVVSAQCPKCNLPAGISLQLATELRVDAAASTLRLQGKSKPATHICGQTTLFEANGQAEAFELSDIVGEDDSPDDATTEPAQP